MQTVKLPAPQYVELYATLAEQIMANGASGMSDYMTEREEGDGTYTECLTEEGQEIFNDFVDIVCDILASNGVESE